jgi:HAD superfamily hydrolase (TIGR01490 family)
MITAGSIGAFFDLDGTLLPAPSLETRFLKYLVSQRLVRVSSVLKWVWRATQPGQFGKFAANKTYLSGLPESVAASWAESTCAQDSSPETLRFFEEGLARIAWHQAQNHRVFLISGTLAPVASQLLRFLPGEIRVMATELATDSFSSMWTGELAGEHMVGFAKLRAMLALANEYQVNLRSSYAYGDSPADRPMLEAVGHPEAVNPSARLARVARQRGWTISNWTLAKGGPNKVQGKLIPITRRAGLMALAERSR